jgi:DNA-binding beta-propeller fold protein YncE
MIDAFDTGGQVLVRANDSPATDLARGNSLQLSTDNRWLFVTNAGSNTISVFEVGNNGLTLTDIVPTGDGSQGQRFPNSVTQHESMVYVLHAADEGSITGFRLNDEGRLSPIPGSTRTLNANQEDFPPDPLFNPAQVSFTPKGNQLVVTIKDGPAEGVLRSSHRPGPVGCWSSLSIRTAFPQMNSCKPISTIADPSDFPSTMMGTYSLPSSWAAAWK